MIGLYMDRRIIVLRGRDVFSLGASRSAFMVCFRKCCAFRLRSLEKSVSIFYEKGSASTYTG